MNVSRLREYARMLALLWQLGTKKSSPWYLPRKSLTSFGIRILKPFFTVSTRPNGTLNRPVCLAGNMEREHRHQVPTVQPTGEHRAYKLQVGLHESGSNGRAVKVLKKRGVVHRASAMCSGAQPHQKAMLQPLQSRKMSRRCTTPDDTRVLKK